MITRMIILKSRTNVETERAETYTTNIISMFWYVTRENTLYPKMTRVVRALPDFGTYYAGTEIDGPHLTAHDSRNSVLAVRR